MASITLVDGLDLSAVRLFLTVNELGSVSKAAHRMLITQPSATAKLHKLERQLGAQLIERTPTGSVPTEAGSRLAPACAELLATATALVDRADAIRVERNRLTVAATRHAAEHFLPQWVDATDLGGSQVAVVEADTLHVARAVRSGEAVLGFFEGPYPPLGLRSAIVARERIVPVVGRRHPWYGRRRAVEPPELTATTLILARPGSGLRDVVESVFAEYELGAVGEHIEVDGSSGARLAALAGTGVAFLPECLVRTHLANGMLHAVAVREPEIELVVRVVWRGSRPATAAARALLATVSA